MPSGDDCTLVEVFSRRLNRPCTGMIPSQPQIALPPTTVSVKPQDDGEALNLPRLRIQALPKGCILNSPPASHRPDNKALARALKVFVPLNGTVHLKISLDLCGLGDHQWLGLREEALKILDGCLRDVRPTWIRS